LPSDPDATFDRTVDINATKLEPFVTWGTSPEMSVKISEPVPDPNQSPSNKRRSYELALDYMGLEPSVRLDSVTIDRAFIGSCTNSRIEDLREAARVANGYKVNSSVKAMIVPGSMQIKRQAEEEGLARVFMDAGFEWR
jgi:3-isopropylmalate/(R)-2-methylmalate dehydratase large subunit